MLRIKITDERKPMCAADLIGQKFCVGVSELLTTRLQNYY